MNEDQGVDGSRVSSEGRRRAERGGGEGERETHTKVKGKNHNQTAESTEGCAT